MAAVRNQSSYTEINSSNSRRSLPTRGQQPRIFVLGKTPRKVLWGVHYTTPPGYKPIRAPTKQPDQPPKAYCPGHDWSSSGFICKKGSPTRNGLTRTSEEKSDQGGHDYADELYDEWQDPQGAYSLRLQQECYEPCCANLQLRHDLTALGSQFSDHTNRSDCWLDGRGYKNIAPKAPPTITPAACLLEMDPDTAPEMLFPPNLFHHSLHEQPVVGVQGIQAWLGVVEAKFFGLNVWQRAICRPTHDQHPRKGRREKWSNNVRHWHDETASKGAFTERLYSRIDTLFFPQKMSFQSPCGSTSSAKVGGSEFLSHPVSEETIAPGELDHFGRNWIRRWKDGPGRNKDWRSNCYLKPMRKGEWAKYQLSSLGHRSCSKRSKATNHHLSNTPFPPNIAVPKDMLRQKSTSCQGHGSHLKPKSSWQAMNEVGLNKKINFLPKSRARCEPWMTDLIDSLDIEEPWRPKDRFSADSEVPKATIDDLLTAMVSTYTETSSPNFKTPNAKSISLNHLLAYGSFVDTILGACLRLKRLLRSEPHYEVYDAESLSDGNQKYEVRGYNLRGLSLKVRNYRIRNLKRASARSSCIGSFEQGGKKWLVLADPQADLIPESSGACSPLWSTRNEYERAFPVLESHKPDDCEKIEKEALQDRAVVEAYDASFEKVLEEELSRRLDAKQAFEVIDKLRERVVTSLKAYHPDDTITPMSEKQKKIKSPEQAKRLRDRQRRSRQTKRRAMAAPRLGAKSNSMSQTLDMASEPPTETSWEIEYNHVAAYKTIAMQVQEDLERLSLCDECRMTTRAWGGTFLFQGLVGQDLENLFFCDDCRMSMRAWGGYSYLKSLRGYLCLKSVGGDIHV